MISPVVNNTSKQSKAQLLGIGLDNKDGHKRMTKAEQFAIIGGSEETHDRMTETLIKTVEDLQSKGKRIETTEPHELAEIIDHNTPR